MDYKRKTPQELMEEYEKARISDEKLKKEMYAKKPRESQDEKLKKNK